MSKTINQPSEEKEDVCVSGKRDSKNYKRRHRKKEIKKELANYVPYNSIDSNECSLNQSHQLSNNIEIEYVSDKSLLYDIENSDYKDYITVFNKFTTVEDLMNKKIVEEVKEDRIIEVDKIINEDNINIEESNTIKKKKTRLQIAELKQKVPHPEVVEMHDGNSIDPVLLCYLKGYRNTIPVPRHWSQKRRYLANRRGWIKPPFQLPSYILDTGIAELRNNVQEDQTLKSKQRSRLQPKLHKLDIDYQVLHDAFFKYQSKPSLTFFGDVYHELKEMDYKLRMKRPGQLSEELKKALGITSPTIPPPWLVNMQRYGPPPAYPNMKIPGLNAPIPPGARYGYNAGEWGKPPVDEAGRPIYGDPFGIYSELEAVDLANTDLSKWGELVPDEVASDLEEEVEDEEEENDEMEEEPVFKQSEHISMPVPVTDKPVVSEPVEVRKKAAPTPVDEPIQMRKELYTVIEEKESNVGGSMFGSSHTYAIPGKEKDLRPDFVKNQLASASDGNINISLAPEELENLDANTLKQKYVAQLEADKNSRAKQKEDFSDVFEEENNKKKRKGGEQKGEKSKKFKF